MTSSDTTPGQGVKVAATDVKAVQLVPARQVLALGSTAAATVIVAGTVVAGPAGTIAAGAVLAGGAAMARRRFTTKSASRPVPKAGGAVPQQRTPNVNRTTSGSSMAGATGRAVKGSPVVDTPARRNAPSRPTTTAKTPPSTLGGQLGAKPPAKPHDLHRSVGANAPAKGAAKPSANAPTKAAERHGKGAPLADKARSKAAAKRESDVAKRLPKARADHQLKPAKAALRRSAARTAARAVWDHARPSLRRGDAEREYRQANPEPKHNANPTPAEKKAVTTWRKGLAAAKAADRQTALEIRQDKRDARRETRDAAIKAALAPLETAVAALEKWADLPDFLPGYPDGALGKAAAVVAAAININKENTVTFFDMSQAAEDVYAAATAAEIEGALGVGKSLMTLPEAIKVIADAFVVIAEKCSPENAPLDPSVADALTVAQGHLIQAASAAEEASNAFQQAHVAEIDRLENQRVNEAAWDVTRNDG